MAITITEALAELKTIDKKIDKKEENIINYLIRQDKFRDPLEKEGGSANTIAREFQAIHDLGERKIAIRRAIQKANSDAVITVGGETRTIADWLTWRREVAPVREIFLNAVSQRIHASRTEALRRGQAVVSGSQPSSPEDIIVNINESKLAQDREYLVEVLNTLDGQLSLKNATLTIDI